MKINFNGFFEEFEPRHYCNSFVATAIIGAGVVGGAATIYSANQAANAQTNAANTAANTALSQFNKVQNNLQPYMNAGNSATTTLTNDLSALTSPITMNEQALQQTPGYQFDLTQGLKSVQNSAAARGLGVSGAALKGAANFATGLADNTQQTQFNIANTNQTNAYNRLAGVMQTGEAAAAGTGIPASIAGNTAASAQIGAGNAQAAAANSVGSAVNSGANNIAGYAIAQGLYGQGNALTGQVNNYNAAMNDQNAAENSYLANGG